MWIIASILSALFAGITAILSKCGVKDTNSDVATAVRTSVVLIFAWIIVLITGAYTTLPDISYPFGTCHGRVMDLLFQGTFFRRSFKGRSRR